MFTKHTSTGTVSDIVRGEPCLVIVAVTSVLPTATALTVNSSGVFASAANGVPRFSWHDQ